MAGPGFFINGPVGAEITAATNLARQWASKVTDPPTTVDGTVNYSAEQNAIWAGESATQAQNAAVEAIAAKDELKAAIVEYPFQFYMTATADSPQVGGARKDFVLIPGNVSQVFVGLLNPQESGDPLTVEFRINSTLIATAVLPLGQRTVRVPTNFTVAVDDIFHALVTQIDEAGGGGGLRVGYVLQNALV